MDDRTNLRLALTLFVAEKGKYRGEGMYAQIKDQVDKLEAIVMAQPSVSGGGKAQLSEDLERALGDHVVMGTALGLSRSLPAPDGAGMPPPRPSPVSGEGEGADASSAEVERTGADDDPPADPPKGESGGDDKTKGGGKKG